MTRNLAPAWARPFSEGWALVAPLALAATLTLRFPPLGLACASAAGLVALALRDPERAILATDDVLAPADGRVVAIELVEDEWVGEALEISIFLALWNVHVQRAPLAGRLMSVRHVSGGFAPALYGQAATNNRQILDFDGDRGRFGVSLISGLIARRIVRWVEPGDKVAAGERIGMIKFGSRVTLRLPRSARPLVAPGMDVRAGITSVASF